MSTHTPGPWKVHNYATNYGPYNKGIDIGPGLRAIATVIGEFEAPLPGATAEANARLIAAAPDLKHELELLLDAVVGSGWMTGQHLPLGPLTIEARRKLI